MLVALLLLSLQGQARDTVLPASFRQLWSRGADSDTLVSFVRLTPNFVSIGPDNHVYLLDRERDRVVELDPAGRTLRTIGRSGHGPAELTNPASLTVAPSGAILVYDFSRQGFVRWSSQRRPLPLLPVPRRQIPNLPRALSDTSVLFMATGIDSSHLWRLTPSALEAMSAAPSAAPKPIGKDICGLASFELPPLFSPGLQWAAWGGGAAIAFGPEAKVTEVTTGATSHTWTAPHPPTRATREMAIQQLGPSRPVIPGQPECRYPPERIVDAVGVAPYLPAYQRLVAASPDTLWAIRFAVRGHPTTADLFSRGKGYLGTVTLGSVNPVGFLSDGKALSLEVTEDDIPLVVVYEVRVGRR